MRISTIQQYNNGVSGLQRNYANVTRTQEQISTGNRILTPADDPVASVRLLQLDQQQGVLDQYASNLTAAKNSLTQEEVTLNSVNTVLQRVRDLAGEAGNGALSTEDRKAIAAELKEREDELFSLMNTRNARGEYLFSGFQGKTQPFVRNADGSYSYEGDEGQRKLQVASSLQIAISDNGKRVFENVINAGRLDSAVTNSPAGSTLSPSAPLVQDEVAFSGNPPFPDTGVQIVFGNPDANSYEIFAVGTTTPVLGSGAIDTDDATDDQVVFRGVSIKFDGVPVGGETIEVTAQPNQQKQGILDTIANLRMALENAPNTPAGNNLVRDSVAEALTNLDNGITVVDSVRGDIGARLNVVESTVTDNEDVTLVNQSIQADLRELDYAEALSRLSFQSIILEASQQSYVKIAGLSLFNKLG
ncbi:flagellar hook-associated protein FlgL [Pseudomonas sp. JS3066]|jgi:flagellar hook-associated protein 3 FlgL|uniref:flagellar hook-associated protein FlgL n=1 Tax=unclassified Pseudomonas TaxID=196821 RepID=UPI000EAA31E2|nr:MULTISPECIES: flagellar hook-associated protein FlgL [unclassified Pseudomonas]AYF85873.1 flagellar hook-associated protein FlgL [Pseudomonas sp. DY-1]WVK91540.1 flagellar hook-associated protein FlgL [Pseudomonas sp. JS3066]